MKLSNEKYNTIKQWMYQNARPLDFARWQFQFEDGSVEAVVNALEAYQNNDGGFGHGIEADCLNPNSSPLQTWWAIQFIKEINLSKDHPMMVRILKYLDSKDGTRDGLWQFTIESNNKYPRAPWWSHTEGKPGYNPSAALVGFILTYGDPESKLYKDSLLLTKEILQSYINRDELTEMHELACFIELYEYLIKLPSLDVVDMTKFSEKLIIEVDETIEHDSSKWATEYCCKPSNLFKSADSVVYQSNKKSMDEELNFIINSLSPEGSWNVTWEWGDFEEEFSVSKKWWQGNIAIWNVVMLRDL